MTKVDPFIPVNGSARRRPVKQMPITPIKVTPFRGSRDINSAPPRRQSTGQAHTVMPQAAAMPRQQPAPSATATPVQQSLPLLATPVVEQERASFGRRLLKNIQMLSLIMGAIILGFAIQYPPVGYAIIAIYALVVALRRIRSRVTFTLALVSVAAAMLARALQREEGMADSFAIYTFLLLTIGTITFLIEVFHANRHLKRGT